MKLLKKILNIPIVWNTLQGVVGANTFKYAMYPSVFKSRSGKLLDFGCACGNSTEAFLDFDYWGVDIDREAIKDASKKFASYPNVKFEWADLAQAPYKPDFFDHVLFAGTIHHLDPRLLPLFIKNLLVSLKVGGELHIFEIIRQPQKDNFITKLFLHLDQGKYIKTESELKAIFKQEGYKIAETQFFPSPNSLIKLPDFVYFRIIK
ncbi:MAG: class I SAM-dependent methyltransferase [Candidatus Vogelbacteria bacterium]|nr:class I SAM-dependent methyltransferase [Candidatus Vogelbacteria bacterium]